jgi:hypothetical protein
VAQGLGRVFKSMTGDSLAFTQAKEITMSDLTDIQNSIEKMKLHMELRRLRPALSSGACSDYAPGAVS